MLSILARLHSRRVRAVKAIKNDKQQAWVGREKRAFFDLVFFLLGRLHFLPWGELEWLKPMEKGSGSRPKFYSIYIFAVAFANDFFD